MSSSYLEVDFAAVVRVEGPEDMLAELFSVSLGEKTRVYLEKLCPRQLTVWAVLL